MIIDEKPAFEVFNRVTGHRYKVWADGQIEGFGDGYSIINRIPSMVAEAEQNIKVEAGLITLVR